MAGVPYIREIWAAIASLAGLSAQVGEDGPIDPLDIDSIKVRMTTDDENLVDADNPFPTTVVDPVTGVSTKVSEDGQMHIVAEGKLCNANSTTTPLLANEAWTGTAQDILAYNGIGLFITSDVASATNGFEVQFSDTGETWYKSENYTLLAGEEKWFTPPAFGKYFRLYYLNGDTDQTTFRVSTVLRKMPFKWSSHNINQAITGEDDATLVKAVITGKNPQGVFVNYQATTAGNFKNSIEEFESGISVNDNTQLRVTPYDERGDAIQVSALGELKIAEPTLVVGSPFSGTTLDTNFWTSTLANGGTAPVDGCITLKTNTTANGSSSVMSVRYARKVPGTINQFRCVGSFATAAQSDNVRTIGVYDTNNGAFFKLDGTTFKVVTRKAGVDTEVSSGAFNGEVTEYTADTNIHRFVIEYSIFAVNFFIDGVLIHKELSTSTTWSKSTTLPAYITNVNANGNVTDNELFVCLLCILRFGKLETEKKSVFQVGTTAGVIAKYGAGELHHVIISAVSQNANVSIYDGLSAAGTLLWSTGSLSAQTLPFDVDVDGLPFGVGLTLVISGANASALLVYE